MVILKLLQFPASSFTVKYCPAAYPAADGNLSSSGADALIPIKVLLTDAVACEDMNLLE